ncbi:hypothetical protein [Staphylococcus aureus]|nr:hypothetical protein [Staphylococcus aureus]
MLTLIKLKEDEQVIIYEYIPEDDISNGFSVVRDFIEKQEFPENYKIAWY